MPFFEEPLEHMAFKEAGADTGLFLKELRVFIDQWLEAQPEKRREIFRRRYIDEQTTGQISREMDIPQKNGAEYAAQHHGRLTGRHRQVPGLAAAFFAASQITNQPA